MLRSAFRTYLYRAPPHFPTAPIRTYDSFFFFRVVVTCSSPFHFDICLTAPVPTTLLFFYGYVLPVWIAGWDAAALPTRLFPVGLPTRRLVDLVTTPLLPWLHVRFTPTHLPRYPTHIYVVRYTRVCRLRLRFILRHRSAFFNTFFGYITRRLRLRTIPPRAGSVVRLFDSHCTHVCHTLPRLRLDSHTPARIAFSLRCRTHICVYGPPHVCSRFGLRLLLHGSAVAFTHTRGYRYRPRYISPRGCRCYTRWRYTRLPRSTAHTRCTDYAQFTAPVVVAFTRYAFGY